MALLLSIFNKYNLEFNIIQIFATFILSLIALVALFLISREMPIIQHIVWFVFILCMSVIIYPRYQSLSGEELFRDVLTVIIIFLVLTAIGFFDQNKIFISWGNYLLIGLLSLIIFELLDIILFYQTTSTRIKLYSMIGLVIFMGFILYDTQYLQIRGEEILKQCGQNVSCANYPIESLNLFLDIINLFSNVSQLNKK